MDAIDRHALRLVEVIRKFRLIRSAAGSLHLLQSEERPLPLERFLNALTRPYLRGARLFRDLGHQEASPQLGRFSILRVVSAHVPLANQLALLCARPRCINVWACVSGKPSCAGNRATVDPIV